VVASDMQRSRPRPPSGSAGSGPESRRLRSANGGEAFTRHNLLDPAAPLLGPIGSRAIEEEGQGIRAPIRSTPARARRLAGEQYRAEKSRL
jgi:hypothetical protein